ncbi:Phage portal protein [Chryseobacterium oranimense G311]|uniref:phage portal protein n=1 Tax=Chryseobacterium oranimense TaxID=421058 RepID=UPI000533B199|nr:phage portal protein [Chryseobacterium oranimense]CEJ71268.1 Phage portal protein [Chryseobacterium oranimense G311]DAG72823.1 MAG TPA: portal protein [Caudoviricetes sp.]
MGFLTKIDNAFHAFKSELFQSSVPNYARLEDGTHSYNYETTQFGFLGLLGIGNEYNRAINNLKYYYKHTLFLQDCINLYADFASQVRIMEVDEKGNEIEGSEYVKFLMQPNAFQNSSDFIKEMVVNYLSSGAVFQYGNYFKNGNLRVSPQLFNLEFNNLAFPKVKNRYVLSRKDIQELEIKECIADSKHITRKLYELAFFYDTIPNNGFGKENYDAENYFKPISRIFSIISSINTINNSQDSMAFTSGHNVNKVLSRDPGSGSSNLTPLAGDQKTDIELKINGRGRYGARKDKIGDTIAVSEALKVLDLTRDMKKMQLVEQQENAKENIRNCFLIPKDFFGESTYENKQFSESRFILGQVKTITDKWLKELVAKTPLYFESRRSKLVGSYDHLPSIAETKTKLENEGFKAKAEALLTLLEVYEKMLIANPKLSWDEFVRVNQFNEHLMIQS